jgi:hypothetical protein
VFFFFLGEFARFRKATISFIMSVCPQGTARLGSARLPLDRLYRNFIFEDFRNLLRKLKFHYNLTRTTSILYEDQCKFIMRSRIILLRVRNVSDKSCRKYHNKNFISNNFYSENRVVYKIMWKNVVQPDRTQMANNNTQGRCELHAE